MPGGERFDHLEPTLSDFAGGVGAASDHADETAARCGTTAVAGLNEALLAQATEAKVLRTTRLRAATTVAPSNGS